MSPRQASRPGPPGRTTPRRLEAKGWSTLLLPDHLGVTSTFARVLGAAHPVQQPPLPVGVDRREPVDVHICTLRQKLDHHGAPLIKTLHGIGYTLRSPDES